MGTSSFPHQVIRLAFDTGQPYEEFRARYEDAVPVLDPDRLAALAEAGAPWADVVADASATHGFLRYWRSDLTRLTGVQPGTTGTSRCESYSPPA